MITLRPATCSDYPRLVEINNADTNWPTTEEEMLEADRKLTGIPFLRLVAALPEGMIIGFGEAARDDESLPNHFFLSIHVKKPYRRQGAGSALLQALSGWTQASGGVCLETSCGDADDTSLRWAKSRGFVVDGHCFKSELPLHGYRLNARYEAALENAERAGFQILSLHTLGPNDNNLRRFHHICQLTEEQVPGRSPRTPSYDLWLNKLASNPSWDPACVLIALAGEEWAGFTFMEKHEDGSWYTHLTGVEPAYRGQGLGTAMKVAAIKLAIQERVPSLTTYNHSVNLAMVRINQQLGYKPIFGFHQIQFDLPK